MNKRLLHHISLFLLLIACATTQAQDIHFSDFYSSPLNLNPALTGMFRGNVRVTGLYRDQYRTVSMPYQTLALSVDCLQRRYRKPRYMLGIGALINYDIAGNSRFSSTQLIVPFAFHFPFNKDKVIVSLGISPGFHFYAVNQNGMRMPNQFIDDRFMDNQPIDDNFSNLTTNVFNLGTGVNIKIYPKVSYSYSLGFAVHNINQPNLSFLSNSTSNVIPRRAVIHFQLRRHLFPRFDLIPELRWQLQSTQQEWQFGLKAMHSLDNLIVPFYEYGLWMRSRSLDAIILHLGCTYRDYVVSLNYDLNISKLQPASSNHGAIEISLLYIYNKANHLHKVKFIKCPTHI